MAELRRRYKEFEDFLNEYYSEKVNPTCLDDNLPDCTSDWIGELDSDDWIRLADIYVKNEIEYRDNQWIDKEVERVKKEMSQ